MISSELPEILRMSDRIVVMCEGRITGELIARGGDARSASCNWRRSAKQWRPDDRWTIPEWHAQRTRRRGGPRRPAGPGLRAQLLRVRQARQKLLAFASLILLLVFFSFASPAFTQMDNILGILQATAVNGVLGDRQHLRHHHRRHRSFGRHADDLLRGHVRRVPDLLGPADVDRRPRRDRRRARSAAPFREP